MALMTVDVAGKKFIVECANKGTAKAWGREKLEVSVSDSTADEITQFMLDGGSIEKLAPAEKKAKAEGDAKPEGDAPAAE